MRNGRCVECRTGDDARRRRSLRPLTFVAVVAVLAATSASSTSAVRTASGNEGTRPSSAAVVSPAKLAKLKALVLEAQKVPVFQPTGPAIDAAAARGAKMVVMPSNSNIAYCSDIAKGAVSLGKEMGISVRNISTSGTVSEWGAGILQAVTTGAKVMALICGIPPAVVTPQLQVAKKKNLTLVFDQSYDLGAPFQVKPPAGAYQTGVPDSRAMRILVDQAIVDNQGKPFHSLIMTSSDIYISAGTLAAVKDQLRKDCGSACQSTVRNIPIAEWATKTQSTIASALASDPQIKAVFVLYAGMTVTGGLAAVQGVHRPGLKIYQWGAGSGDLKQMQGARGIVAGDIGCGSAWSYYVLMDQMLRLALDKPAASPAKGTCQIRLFTPANVGEFFKNGGFGNSYVTGYRKQWGLSK